MASEDTDGSPAPPSGPARRHGVPKEARTAAPPGPSRTSGQPASPENPAFRPGAGAWERVRASAGGGTSTAISGQSLPDSPGGVELAVAIAALRDALERAWRDSQEHGTRFEVEPVELTLHVGLARTGQGSAAIEWHVRVDEHMLPQPGVAQTLTIRFTPRLAGGRLTSANADQAVPHREDAAGEPLLPADGLNDSGM